MNFFYVLLCGAYGRKQRIVGRVFGRFELLKILLFELTYGAFFFGDRLPVFMNQGFVLTDLLGVELQAFDDDTARAFAAAYEGAD